MKMKLNYDRNSKNPTYFVQQGFRVGEKTSTRNVYTIGKHNDLLEAGIADPLEYAKSVVKKYNEDFKKAEVDIEITVNFKDKVPASKEVVSKSTLKNNGYLYLQHIYEELQIKKFLSAATKGMKIEYDPDTINKILTIDRIIDPHSKLATVNNLNKFLGNIDFSHQDVLRFMDILSQNYDNYLAHLFDKSTFVVDRDTSVCYYDCTNFYFEIEKEDEEYVDPYTGEVMKGLRRYGYSKEHRPNPIVQMGLFMDKDGIPLTMDLFHGSNNEQNTVKPLENKLVRMLKNKKIIYCSDAGLASASNRVFNTMGGRAYIVTQSLKNLTNELKEKVFDDEGYKLLSSNETKLLSTMKKIDPNENLDLYNDLIYKEIYLDSDIDLGLYEEKICKNGNIKKQKSKAYFKQKIIITFSRKLQIYQKKIRDGQVERAKRIIETNSVDTKKKGNNDVTRFISKADKSKKVNYVLDLEKIANEEKFDGFYCIATNLIDDKAKDIIQINSQRFKIEDCFRVLKTNFEGRPAYHQRPDRIKAHFLICYTSLLIYRLLEKKLADKNYHFTINQILKTIKNMNVHNHDNMYYEATYMGSQVLNAFEDVFHLDLNKKYYQINDLNKKSKKILK